MNLYLIKTDVSCYDGYDAHVVAATSDYDARLLAIDIAADEGEKAWNAQHSTVSLLAGDTQQPHGIVLSSFNAG